ncbi:MAG: DUF433 domain-containing protein [Candidatus Helarchaeota archaeon]
MKSTRITVDLVIELFDAGESFSGILENIINVLNSSKN